MPDWTSVLGTAIGYAIAAGLFVLPVVLLMLVLRSRWFARRKRIRWATPEMPLVWWRTTMDRLPPPFNEDPKERGRRR